MIARPRPWKLVPWDDDPDCSYFSVIGSDDALVCSMGTLKTHHMADAEFLVRAVNAFDALLAVVRAVDRASERIRTDDPLQRQVLNAVLAFNEAHPDWRTW